MCDSLFVLVCACACKIQANPDTEKPITINHGRSWQDLGKREKQQEETEGEKEMLEGQLLPCGRLLAYITQEGWMDPHCGTKAIRSGGGEGWTRRPHR